MTMKKDLGKNPNKSKLDNVLEPSKAKEKPEDAVRSEELRYENADEIYD